MQFLDPLGDWVSTLFIESSSSADFKPAPGGLAAPGGQPSRTRVLVWAAWRFHVAKQARTLVLVLDLLAAPGGQTSRTRVLVWTAWRPVAANRLVPWCWFRSPSGSGRLRAKAWRLLAAQSLAAPGGSWLAAPSLAALAAPGGSCSSEPEPGGSWRLLAAQSQGLAAPGGSEPGGS